MPEHVNIHPERGFAEIVSDGQVTIEHMKDARKKVAVAYKSNSISGLLYDVRQVTQPPNSDDLREFAEQTSKIGKFQGIRVSLVTSEDSAFPHSLLTATANRLGQLIRVFRNRQVALKWLSDEHNGDSFRED